MKKAIVLFLAAIISAGAWGKELTANLSWCAFNGPDNKSYVETYLSVIGNSLVYTKNKSGKWQAAVDVLMIFTQDDSIRCAKHYTLNSPEEADSADVQSFLDLQRIPLPTGYYSLQITLTDMHRDPVKPITNKRSVLSDIDPDSVCLSHLEILESYTPSLKMNVLTKSGYDLVPYVSSFIPENMNKLSFYGEIYHTTNVMKADEKFLVLYYIESSQGTKMEEYNAFVKLQPQQINSFLYSFQIDKLPSGTYNLVVEVRNSSNRLLGMRKNQFERYNPSVAFSMSDVNGVDITNTFASRITNGDTLADYIRSLRPISSENEVDFAENRIKAGDIKLMQQFLYNFWLARDEKDPEGAWNKYNLEVQKVNTQYGTQTLRGYETDRGRVYLQYGPPDQMVSVTTEPSSYPYEIWQYYRIAGPTNTTNVNQPGNTAQTNRKFVFADFDLATNNYQLIHSDARGEVRDDNWQVRLLKRDNAVHNLDQQTVDPQYGGNSTDWYNDPH
ncbi:MAG TPA: GWxTD domain-containing protein [Bacteroidia bacterium]|jgi:GWxTD domain-containing protein|nr:GWxTD domain-containing protein [Bacteroidia bacterium]